MKKIALCSLLACMCVSGVDAATYNCEVQEISSLSWKVSNEFLFPTYGDYNDANGRAYVCGHRGTNGCDSGAMVLIAGEHYYTNNRQEDELYRCSTNGANAWAKSNKDVLPKCTSDQIKNFTLFGEIAVGKRRIYCKNAVGTYSAGGRCVGRNAGDICWTDYCEDCNKQEERRDDQHDDHHDDHDDDVIVNGCTDDSQCPIGKKCMYVDGDKSIIGGAPMWADLKGGVCYDAEHIDCFRAAGLGDPTIWSGNPARCSCGKKNGIDYDWRPELRKCVAKGGNDPVAKSCKERRATAEGKACCDIPASEAVWANNKCNCLNDKEFKIENGRGQCVDKNGPVPPVPPVVPDEESDCYYTFNVDINCSNGIKYVAGERVKLTKEQAAQFGGCDATTAKIQSIEDIIERTKREYTAAANLMLLICGNSSATIQPNGPSDSELVDATRTLESFASSASSQASVWKDADGKFNTARLASDLTAGVVLGTVGGVVSGVVIKKKQVEKGFDALHCTVGGQKIADWGDTFSVGLQK